MMMQLTRNKCVCFGVCSATSCGEQPYILATRAIVDSCQYPDILPQIRVILVNTLFYVVYDREKIVANPWTSLLEY